MKKIVFLLVLFAIVTVSAFSQIYLSYPYTNYKIRFKTNTGGTLTTGGNYTYFYVNTSGNVQLGSNEDGDRYLWTFVPVGLSEPGWYYIRNGNGNFLQSTNGSNTSYVGLTATAGAENTKWRLIKNQVTGTDAGSNRHFRLASKSGNNNYEMYRVRVTNNSYRIRTTSTYNTTNATVEIIPADDGAIVYNEDMELVSVYDPYPNGSNTWPGRPPVTDNPDFSTPSTGESDYFPIGFTRTQGSAATGARVIHSNVSSGDSETDGFYFVRLSQGDALNLTLNNPQYTAGTVFRISYWARVSAASSLEGVGSITASNTSGSVTRSLPVNATGLASELEDPDGWYFYVHEFQGAGQLGANTKVSIANTMTNGNGILDIDNFQVIVRAYDAREFLYKRSDNQPQETHQLTQVIYTLPDRGEELSAVTEGYAYYRWHKDELEDPAFTPVATTSWLSNKGLIFYGSPAQGKNVRYQVPSTINDIYPHTVTCDAANYSDYVNTPRASFKEPTLSFRNHFEFRPAWEIAKAINDSIANGSVFEYRELDASVNIRLRLTPQYILDNYWMATGNTREAITGNELLATTFSWRAAGQDAVSNNTTSNPNPIANAGIYEFKGTNQKYLQINTANKRVGDSEYFDVYATRRVSGSNVITRKIARFKVTYVDKTLSGPLTPPSGDLLSVITDKRLINKLSFDRESLYGMGTSRLGLNETSYGFMDPSHFVGNGTTATDPGTHYSAAPCGFWSEYSFPQAVNAGITSTGGGVGRMNYGWSTTSNVHDRTYINTGTLGNMMYVDAAQVPGIFATLDFNGVMCPGTELYFSTWIVNLNDYSATDLEEEGTVRPNLVFILKDRIENKEIKRFYTGDVGYRAVGQWQQIAFRFTIPVEYDNKNVDFRLELRNNGIGTTGNDFALDDICVYRSNPAVTAERSATPYCKPEEGEVVVQSPEMIVSIDLTKFIMADGNRTLFFRFLDPQGIPFPDTPGTYPGQGFDDQYSYGSIDLDNLPAGAEIIADTLRFTQPLSPEVLNNGNAEGIFTIYVAESASSLSNVTCSGEAQFELSFDDTDFLVYIEGKTDPVDPRDLVACTNNIVQITARSLDVKTREPLYTFYDWYYGPIVDYEATEEEKEQEAFDPTLNYIGFNTRTVHFDAYQATDLTGEGNLTTTTIPEGDFSVRDDLKAYRFFYPYPTAIEEDDITCWPRKRVGMDPDNCEDEGADGRYGPTDYPGITSLAQLNALLDRMRFYTTEKDPVTGSYILYLHKRTMPVKLNSLAPYFFTVIPPNEAVRVDAEGEPIWNQVVGICATPAQVRVQATAWGPGVIFGEVDNNGQPMMDYPSAANPDYVYTVRLPEKNRLKEFNTSRFVVPLTFLDELRNARIYLIKVDDVPVNIPVDDKGLENVHLGVIHPDSPNMLDQAHTIQATREHASGATGNYVEVEPYDLSTYWNLGDDRGPQFALESYPLVHNSYHYFNPDPYPAHLLEDEGRPYPVGTHGSPTNKIGLEIQATSIPAQWLDADGRFRPGGEYLFRMACTAEVEWGASDFCDKEFYFRLKVIPEVVYWDNSINTSWHNDTNWKDASGNAVFAPLRPTHVVMKENQTNYPTLNLPPVVTFDTQNDEPVQTAPETRYIEFDYNFEPNSCTEIRFEMGSELGRQYYLAYDSAKVDLNVETMRWYGLSAPLRNLYTGDYMFERANPLTEIRLHNTINPQTGATSTDWTTPFNNTNIELSPGFGYSARVGSLFYTQFLPDPDQGVVFSSRSTIESAEFAFPKDKMLFPFYNELTKMKVDKTEVVPEGGRDFKKRFIYEITQNDQSVVPDQETLARIPVNRKDEGLVVVGNPLMAHIDFEKFYQANYAVIKPEFKILNGGNSYITMGAVDTDNDGIMEGPVSSDGGLTWKSIPPMQSFIVTTKSGYTGMPDELVINKDMSVVYSEAKLRSTISEPGVLRIRATRDNLSTQAAVVLSDTAHDEYVPNEDSRCMFIKNVKIAPSIFTIADNMYLDINRIKVLPDILPIGISTSNKGLTRLIISGLDGVPGIRDMLFHDKDAARLLPLGDGTTFEYQFDNTEGDLLDRFCLVRQSLTSMDEVSQGRIYIYLYNHVVHVISLDGSEIKDLIISGSDGRTIYQRHNTGSSHIEVPVPVFNSILIVKAGTEHTTKVTKVLNK